MPTELVTVITGTSTRYEHDLAVAEGNYVLLHGRFSGIGLPKSWVAVDIVRLADAVLTEPWDVIEDEAARSETQSGLPKFGKHFREDGVGNS